jgi:single-strand DNA-binding protein
MLNQLVLVGRVIDDIKKENLENGKEQAKITIAVPRSYKNENGEYATDFITCNVFGNLVNNVNEYCKKGDLIGIKGRIENTNNNMQVIVERMTFLSSKKREDD